MGYVDESMFKLLYAVLKILESKDVEKKTPEEAIIDIIDFFDEHTLPHQKDTILKEFVKYEQRRRNRLQELKRKTLFESQGYRDLLEQYIKGEGFVETR